jgi:hypothetical protein
MSASGHKRTFAPQKVMSALPPKADMCSATRDVRFVPIADVGAPVSGRCQLENGLHTSGTRQTREYRRCCTGSEFTERFPVADILIRCPIAGVAIQTGLSTEKLVFRSLPNISYQLRCPRCKKIHRWRPKDAWVEKLKGNEVQAAPNAGSED